MAGQRIGPVRHMIGIESVILVALIVTNILQLRTQVFVPPGVRRMVRAEAADQRLQRSRLAGRPFLAPVLAGGWPGCRVRRGRHRHAAGRRRQRHAD